MSTDRDLNWFIDTLRERGLLYDVHREVDPVHELGAVLSAAERTGHAALFHSVKGHTHPVVGSVLSSHAHIAAALECEVADIGDRVQSALDNLTRRAEVAGPAPCQESVMSEPDLGALPIPVHAPNDGGRFINAGIFVARDPAGGRHTPAVAGVSDTGRGIAGASCLGQRRCQGTPTSGCCRENHWPRCRSSCPAVWVRVHGLRQPQRTTAG